VFNNVFDWTAVGTLALAAVTLALAAATFWMVKLTRRSLEQTRDEINVSRREVEEAHRPVLVPVVDSTSYMDLGADGAGRKRRPQLEPGGQLFVPVENIGSGPALNIEASVSGTSIPDEARTSIRPRPASLA
jgi:hypothetical protein